SNRLQRRRAFIVAAGLVNCTATWLMGHTTQFWQLVVLTAVVWFCAGVATSMVTILAGMYASADERGKVFGILALNVALGALIGAGLSGRIVDHWGFQALFTLAAPCWLVQPFSALFVDDRRTSRAAASRGSSRSSASVGAAFYLFLLASVLA